MPKYKYQARGDKPDLIQGVIEADNEAQVISELEKKGLYPIQINKAEPVYSFFRQTSGPKIKHLQLSLLMQQLYDLVSSGISLLPAFEILEEQAPKKNLKLILQGIIEQLKDGTTLSDSMQHYPNTFPPLMINLIRSGEASGALEKVLKRLSLFYEQADEIRSKVKAAMAYPIFVASVGVLTVFVLLGFVIPRITTIFLDLGQSLPLITRTLIFVSSIFENFWWLFLIILILSVWFIRAISLTDSGKRILDQFLHAIPFIGQLRLKNELTRFARTFETLLSNGVPMIQSLELVRDVCSSPKFQDELVEIRKQVSAGARLKDSLLKSQYLPLTTAHMIAIGEESGQLEHALTRVADSYERALDRQIKLSTSLLEPILILIIGAIVGVIVMAILLPIFQINLLMR